MSFHVKSPNINASGSVTTGLPNKTPIATTPYGNAPGLAEIDPLRGVWHLKNRLENDNGLSETDKAGVAVA
jgi:hypothetical protein